MYLFSKHYLTQFFLLPVLQAAVTYLETKQGPVKGKVYPSGEQSFTKLPYASHINYYYYYYIIMINKGQYHVDLRGPKAIISNSDLN